MVFKTIVSIDFIKTPNHGVSFNEQKNRVHKQTTHIQEQSLKILISSILVSVLASRVTTNTRLAATAPSVDKK